MNRSCIRLREQGLIEKSLSYSFRSIPLTRITPEGASVVQRAVAQVAKFFSPHTSPCKWCSKMVFPGQRYCSTDCEAAYGDAFPEELVDSDATDTEKLTA